MAGDGIDLDVLQAQVRHEGAAALFPPRLAGTVRLPGLPVVRDGLTLPGGTVLVVVESGDEVVVSPIVPGHGGIRRALPGDGAFAGIVRLVAERTTTGRFRTRVFAPVPAGRDERAIDVDQSNDSIVVGDEVVAKVYARTAPGPQPGLELPAHLAAVRFERIPRPYGALLWEDEEGREVLLATVSAYLPGAEDGWDWYVRLLLAWVDGEGSSSAATEPASALGGLVAGLHRALATPSPVFPQPVSTVGRDVVASWRRRAEETLDEALAVAVAEVRPRLEALAPRVRAALDGFDVVEDTPAMRIHGDLHVGQVLRWTGGYAVSDFDGNPLAPLEVRTAVDTPARDVAGMVRALDHVARVVVRRRPGSEADVEGWLRDARVGFLEAYRAGLRDLAALFDERLLFPLEVAQECHEHVYAARYLPRWSYVPDLALPALLEGAGA